MTHRFDLAPELIVINASSSSAKSEAWKVAWGTWGSKGSTDYRRDLGDSLAVWEPYDMDSELGNRGIGPQTRKRALPCRDRGIDSEPPDIDSFG